MFEDIKNAYLRTRSIEKTVEETGINEYKVRRALLTLGLWESERSREVKALLEQGLSKEEIAESLHLSIKGLESYLPYSRGAYLEKESQDSTNSKRYRKRKRSALDRQIHQVDAQKEKKKEEKETKTMKDNERGMNEEIDETNVKVYRIKLSLDMDEEDVKELRIYGRAKEGVSRTILVPSSMELNRLNYAIQKCFGFQNCHLHHFALTSEDFIRVTGNDLETWKGLAGKIFRCFFAEEGNGDYYYLEDYDGHISFNSWLKRKYSKPYAYRPYAESDEAIKSTLEHVRLRKELDYRLEPSLFECAGTELLERLTMEEVFKISNSLIYEYDYGDGWEIHIDLLEEIAEEEAEEDLKEAASKVRETLAPICLEVDGLPVVEDVGGVGGFIAFLKGIKGEEGSLDYTPELLEWARSQGWSGRLSKPEKLL